MKDWNRFAPGSVLRRYVVVCITPIFGPCDIWSAYVDSVVSAMSLTFEGISSGSTSKSAHSQSFFVSSISSSKLKKSNASLTCVLAGCGGAPLMWLHWYFAQCVGLLLPVPQLSDNLHYYGYFSSDVPAQIFLCSSKCRVHFRLRFSEVAVRRGTFTYMVLITGTSERRGRSRAFLALSRWQFLHFSLTDHF